MTTTKKVGMRSCVCWLCYALSAAVALSALAGSAAAVEYGTVTGKFVFDGKAPEMKPLVITKDGPVCDKHKPMDERLVVAKDGGLANSVIYVLGDPKDVKAAVKDIHPSYDALKGKEVVFDNKNCRFEPHLQKLWTAQKLVLANSDSVGHNSYGAPFENKAFNPLIPAGGKLAVELPIGEKTPIQVTCSIHSWMKGWILVRPDPYMAVSAADGSFTIENVPVGEHTFQLWHESLLYLKNVNVGGKTMTERQGKHKFTVKAGKNDLGKITVAAKDYKPQIDKLK